MPAQPVSEPACLKLANRPSELVRLAEWLQDYSVRQGLLRQVAFRLELVLTEAITNVLDHALPPEREGDIQVSCVVRDGCVAVRLSDDGPPFDPTSVPPPSMPGRLEEARPGGLGIHLMRQYTNGMEYRRESGHNVLCLFLPLEQTPTD